MTGAATSLTPVPDVSNDDQPVDDGSRVPAAPAGLPDRPEDQGPTAGRLFDLVGRQVHPEVLASGRDRSILDDLKLPPRARLSWAVQSHVESQVARMMRQGQAPRHSVVVINNAKGPCGWLARRQGDDLYGTSCEELLPGMLPQGASLTVRWRDQQGVQRSETYRGTGEYIRRPT